MVSLAQRSSLHSFSGATQGISNSAVNIQRQEHLRPRRALTKDSDTGRLVVVGYSTEAAEAQARLVALFWCCRTANFEKHTQKRAVGAAPGFKLHPPTPNGPSERAGHPYNLLFYSIFPAAMNRF